MDTNKTIVYLLIIIIITTIELDGQNVEANIARKVAENYISYKLKQNCTTIRKDGQKLSKVNNNISIESELCLKYPGSNEKLGCTYFLSPGGFVITSSNRNIQPIIAYSMSSDINSQSVLFDIVRQDLSARNKAVEEGTYEKETRVSNITKWRSLETNNFAETDSSNYIPDENGLLETAWGQATFYNDECPEDPVTNTDCLTGCVATAMGQIINYWWGKTGEYPDSISFNSNWNYTSVLGSDTNRREIYIDVSEANFNNISYPLIENKVNDRNKIAQLLFACGVILKMNYSSEYSSTSTWRVPGALQHFKFISAKYDKNPGLNNYKVLKDNIMHGMPCLLSISGNDGGHAVVVEGYKKNTENEFLIQMGNGGSAFSTWYSLPNINGFSTVESAVVNILPEGAPVASISASQLEGTINTVFELDATGSTDTGKNPSEIQLRWDWNNDGIWDTPFSATKTAIHQYSKVGNYIVNLQVKDNSGLFNFSSKNIQVTHEKWCYNAGALSSPAIALDGTIYIGGSRGILLQALNQNGTKKWMLETGLREDWGKITSPVIGLDGTIYIGSDYSGYLYAINHKGNIKWIFNTGGAISNSPALGSNGRIYVGNDKGTFYALDFEGKEKWKFKTEGQNLTCPTIGIDSTIYVGVINNSNIYAFTSEGNINWKITLDEEPVKNLVLGEGCLYIVGNTNYLYNIDTSGTLNWEFDIQDKFTTCPVVGTDGTVYIGSNEGDLYAINSRGILKWKYSADGYGMSSVIGKDGTIHYAVGNDNSYNIDLFSINPDGTKRGSFSTPIYYYDWYNNPDLVMDNNGIIYFGGYKPQQVKLYAFVGQSGGLANSPWPMSQHDLRHTKQTKKIINTAPVFIKVLKDTTIYNNQEFTFQYKAYDSDNQSLYFWMDDNIEGMSISKDGKFRWDIPEETKSKYKITVFVSDNLDTVCTSANVIVSDIVPISSGGDGIPDKFLLKQNYPNPFNSFTIISYCLPKESKIKLTIFNLYGKKIKTLINKNQKAGYYKVKWNPYGLASGMYFYRIKASNFTEVKKLLLVK